MNLPDYFLEALFGAGEESDQIASGDDTLIILTQQLVEEVLDDLFDIKKSALLRWRDPESILKIEELHLLATERSCVSLRGLYYRLAPNFRGGQASMVSTLSKITNRLDLAKEQLGVIPAAKGLVFGAIKIDNDICNIQEAYIDQFLADSAQVELQCDKVLIVEKHSVFDNIVRASLLNFDKAVLLTGRGFPDCATHRFLSRIRDSHENIKFYYLGDYDPHGLQICMTYRKTLPDLTWVGILLVHIQQYRILDGLMPLSEKDARLLSNIMLRADDELKLTEEPTHQCSIGILLREAEQMIELQAKCEIEALDNSALAQIISFL